MWFIIWLVLSIDIALIGLFILIYVLKVKQIKLNKMLNLYKAKRKLPAKKISRYNTWNSKLAVVCSLFIVVNITGVFSLKSSIPLQDNAKTYSPGFQNSESYDNHVEEESINNDATNSEDSSSDELEEQVSS